MNRFLLTSALTLIAFNASFADAIFYNADATSYKIRTTLPAGTNKETDLDPSTSSLGHSQMVFDYRIKQVKGEVLDANGTTVWSGPVDVHHNYLVYTSKGTPKVMDCGYNSGKTGSSVVVFNITEEQGPFDLVAESGAEAKRGLKLPTAFSPTAKMIPTNSSESGYEVHFKTAAGEDVTTHTKITPNGYSYVIFKNAEGNYDVEGVGYAKK